MSDVTTAYKIRLFFQVDRSKTALSFLESLGQKSKQAAGHTKGLADELKGLAAAAGAAGGLALAKSAFIDFNAEMESSKIGMAGILQLNLGGYFSDASVQANKLVGDFQQIAKASVGTTKDFTTFAQSIMAPVMMANMGLGDTAKRITQLKTLTKGGVIASTVLGEDPEMAGRDIEQWLMGTLSAKDRFSKKLLGPMGMSTTQVNALSPEKRLALLEKALTQPAIVEATKAYENSWLGVKSTLEDTLQMLAGSIGLPLFKAITAEVKSWNAWIDKNPEKIEEFAKTVSNLLLGAFGVAKDVFGFIVQNKDLLLTLAKAVLISKGVGMAGRLLSSPLSVVSTLAERFGNLGSAVGGASGATLSFAEKMTKGAAQLQGAVGLLGAVYVGANALAELISSSQQKRIEAKKEVSNVAMHLGVGGQAGALDTMADRRHRMSGRMMPGGGVAFGLSDDGARAAAAKKVLAEAREAGLLDANGQINLDQVGKIGGGPKYVPGTGTTLSFGEVYRAAGAKRTLAGSIDPATGMPVKFGSETRGSGLPAEWLDKSFSKEMDFLSRLQDAMEVDRKAQADNAAKFLTGLSLADMLNPTKLLGAAMAADNATKNGQLKQPTPKKGDVNVNIRKVEVVADDPDRVVIGILSAAEDAVRNPSTATTSFRDR